MKLPINQATVYSLLLLLLGLGLWGGFSMHFHAQNQLAYEPNPACMKGSPYGKVLALAMQGPIDFYWHQGQTHEHSATLKTGHDHGDGTGHHHHHDHDHAGHDGAHQHESDDKAATVNAPQKPLREQAKDHLKKMSATAHRKTDGKPLTPAHVKYLQSVTEDKLRLAYELDPTNYTNYGNLHLFLATTSFGKGDADDSRALELARATLEICKQDQIDPASWVTAASAAYNIIYHIGLHHDQYTVAEAEASLNEFDNCIEVYERLLDDAVHHNRIPSAARLHELNERVRYMGKIRHAQGVYMQRMIDKKKTKDLKPKPVY